MKYDGHEIKAIKIGSNTDIELIVDENESDLYSIGIDLDTTDDIPEEITEDIITRALNSFEYFDSPYYGRMKRYLPVAI